MLASKWTGQDVSGWWLSEKLDGCRAFWDPTTCTLRTRGWKPIAAPDWFTANFPAITLDGELFAGYGTLELVKVLVEFPRADDAAWRRVRFMAFDAPTVAAIPVERRFEVAQRIAERAGLGWVQERRCIGAEDARATLAAVVARGGEGLVLRRPGHCYEFGRSRAWQKVKPNCHFASPRVL